MGFAFFAFFAVEFLIISGAAPDSDFRVFRVFRG
jgi:hypothetical protein